MSIKKLFNSTNKSRNYLSDANEKDAFKKVESAHNVKQAISKQETFEPQIDYSEPENFARFGSAKLYYQAAMERIYNYYPYDGSEAEINQFLNESLDIEKYVLNNLYPRTYGYANFDSSSYIDFTGGPHTLTNTKTAKLFDNPAASQRGYANVYDTDIYQTKGLPSDYASGSRESNLKSNFDNGVTVEFWLKVGTIDANDLQTVLDITNNESPEQRLQIQLSGTSGSPFRITLNSGSVSSSLIQLEAGPLHLRLRHSPIVL